MKNFLSNKPWKSWKTRKFSFIYCLLIGTLTIVFGGILMFLDKGFDSATWMSETLNFCKFIIGTGTAIILIPSTKDFIEIFAKKDSDEG